MRIIKDGNAFAVVRDDFVNLQESPAYFFEEKTIPLAELDVFGLEGIPPELWPPICEALDVDPKEVIKERLGLLADELNVYDDALDNVEDAKIELEATEEWETLEGAKKHSYSIKESIDHNRNVINALTVLAYKQSGEKQDKKPVPGVGIRVGQLLKYDQGKAVDHCKENLPAAIVRSVDKKLFESYAKTLAANKTPLDFVTVEEKITPTIAKDLSEYLEE
jgi:hypothetical protein